MRKKLIATLVMLTTVLALTKNVEAKQTYEEPKEIKITCYCPESCAGTITATGKKVRKGICAVDKAHLGATALIWTLDGEFLGFYECEDTGGQPIKNGEVIDVWMPSLEEATEFICETGSTVLVQYVWAEG